MRLTYRKSKYFLRWFWKCCLNAKNSWFCTIWCTTMKWIFKKNLFTISVYDIYYCSVSLLTCICFCQVVWEIGLGLFHSRIGQCLFINTGQKMPATFDASVWNPDKHSAKKCWSSGENRTLSNSSVDLLEMVCWGGESKLIQRNPHFWLSSARVKLNQQLIIVLIIE